MANHAFSTYRTDEEENLVGALEDIVFIRNRFRAQLTAALRAAKEHTHGLPTLGVAVSRAVEDVIAVLDDALVQACITESDRADASGFSLRGALDLSDTAADIRKLVGAA